LSTETRDRPGVSEFLESLRREDWYRGQIVHIERIAAREARYARPVPPLPPVLEEALASLGVKRLYTHQVAAREALRNGLNIVVVSGTASGKTLCYNIPVLESLLEDPSTRALYLFPTKALAQDQRKSLEGLLAATGLEKEVKVGTYDGDTTPPSRRRLRKEASIILSNPDMLHQGILPYHAKWSGFFKNLEYVVIDEIHAYRGVFGSHVGNVLRRLKRVCRHYGSAPRFVCCSATISNPREFAEKLTGERVRLVDDDGSPRGEKAFVFWNPPYLDSTRSERRSSNVEGMRLLVKLVESGIQTILFTKARVVAELIYRYASDELAAGGKGLEKRIAPYRGGYLPEERRRIEKELFEGRLLGVVSTNALELGIDVGALDASVLVGFPPTIASAWQQAGRAGRGTKDSLTVAVAYNDPIDQYLVHHPEYFFGTSPESAIIDPENPYVLVSHLGCAAFELPLSDADREYFGPASEGLTQILEEESYLKGIDGRWYWSSSDHPGRKVSLRTISGDSYTIADESRGNEVIGTVDSISALELIYPEAVYMHEGETYFVSDLDLKQKTAFVRKSKVDYYTQPVLDSHVKLVKPTREHVHGGRRVLLGDCSVKWRTVGFKKVKFYTLESIGYKKLDLPELGLDTVSFVLLFEEPSIGGEPVPRGQFIEGLQGVRNLMVSVLPIFAMCDRQDIGGVVDSSNFGSPAIFLYDRYPGGIGYAEKAFLETGRLLRSCYEMVIGCQCEDGCPSCVGLPVLLPAQQQDPDLWNGRLIPNKKTATLILEDLLRLPAAGEV